MKYKQYISGILLIALSIYVITTYGYTVNQKELKVGAVLATSGSHAYYGEEALRGLKLAQSALRKSDGITVDLLVQDTAGKPASAVNVANKFIFQDKVDSLITFSGAGAALSVIPIANQNKVVQMELICYAAGCQTEDDYVFRVSGEADVEPAYISHELITRGIKNVFVVSANTEYGKSMDSYFTKHFENAGGNIVGRDVFQSDQSDFRNTVLKIKSTKEVQKIVFFGFGELKYFMKQLVDMKIDVSVFSTQTAENPEIRTLLGSSILGKLEYSYPGDQNRYEYVDFKNRYKDVYGVTPSYAAYKAYDALMLLTRVQAGCLKESMSDCTKSALMEIKNYPGVSNVIQFNKYGDISGEVFQTREYKVGE